MLLDLAGVAEELAAGRDRAGVAQRRPIVVPSVRGEITLPSKPLLTHRTLEMLHLFVWTNESAKL